MARAVVGIDLGGTKVQGVVLETGAGVVLGRAVAGTPAEGGPTAVAERIAAVTLAAAESAGVAATEIGGVGIGSAGQVDLPAGVVVLDGRLRRGPRGLAGEIGHIVVVDGGDPCPCGRRGCTEAYAGRAPMEWAVRAALAAGRPTSLVEIQRRLGRSRLTTEVLAEALAAGDLAGAIGAALLVHEASSGVRWHPP